jgi:hypothetical protein
VINVETGPPDANIVPPDDTAYQEIGPGLLVVAIKVADPVPQIDTSLVTGGGGVVATVISTLAVVTDGQVPLVTTALNKVLEPRLMAV